MITIALRGIFDAGILIACVGTVGSADGRRH